MNHLANSRLKSLFSYFDVYFSAHLGSFQPLFLWMFFCSSLSPSPLLLPLLSGVHMRPVLMCLSPCLVSVKLCSFFFILFCLHPLDFIISIEPSSGSLTYLMLIEDCCLSSLVKFLFQFLYLTITEFFLCNICFSNSILYLVTESSSYLPLLL